MFDWASQPEIWISLLTLTALEIVLGIDNIVFISILTGKLPEAQRARVRRILQIRHRHRDIRATRRQRSQQRRLRRGKHRMGIRWPDS